MRRDGPTSTESAVTWWPTLPEAGGSSVVLAGADNIGALAFARALRHTPHEVWVAAPSAVHAARSRAVEGYARTPPPGRDPRGFAGAVADLADRIGAAVVVPVNDVSTEVLAAHRTVLPAGAVLAAPDTDVVQRCTDKAYTARVAVDVGFGVPADRLVSADAVPADLQFPVVVKPERSELTSPLGDVQRFDTRVARDDRQLRAALAALPAGRGHVQTFLHGRLHALCGLRWGGRIVGPVHMEVERTWPLLTGPFSAAQTTVDDPALTTKADALLDRLGWDGLFELDLLSVGSHTYLLDVNTSVFTCLALPVAAGINLPALFVDAIRHGDVAEPPPARAGVRYRHLLNDARALAGQVRQGDFRALRVPRVAPANTVHPLWSITDPLPATGLLVKRWGADAVARRSAQESGPPVGVGTSETLVVAWEELEEVADEWDELARRPGNTPFLRPGWMRAWWTAFGGGALRVLTVRDNGRLEGALPLVLGAPLRVAAFRAEPLPLSRRGRSVRSPANWYSPEWRPVVTAPAVARVMGCALGRERRPNVGMAMLHPGRTGVDELLGTLDVAGNGLHVHHLSPSPYVATDLPWSEYARTRSSKLLADLRRRERRLAEQGELRYEVHQTYHDLASLLEEGFAIEPSGWKAVRRSSIASRRETLQFYADVAEWAAEGGLLRLCFLRVGRRAVAFQFALEDDEAFYLLKGGYDPACSQFAPGKLLVRHLLERCCDGPVRRLEFLGGDESWKLEWATGEWDRVVAHAFAPSALGTLERFVVVVLRPWRASVRSRARTLVRTALRRRS